MDKTGGFYDRHHVQLATGIGAISHDNVSRI